MQFRASLTQSIDIIIPVIDVNMLELLPMSVCYRNAKANHELKSKPTLLSPSLSYDNLSFK